jgi:hypothetical protein
MFFFICQMDVRERTAVSGRDATSIEMRFPSSLALTVGLILVS